MQLTKSRFFLAARCVQLDNEVTPPPGERGAPSKVAMDVAFSKCSARTQQCAQIIASEPSSLIYVTFIILKVRASHSIQLQHHVKTSAHNVCFNFSSEDDYLVNN